jgi:hypothetical protein
MRFAGLTVAASFCFSFASIAAGQDVSRADDTTRLRERLRYQQQRLDDLQKALDDQRRAMEDLEALIMNQGQRQGPDALTDFGSGTIDTASPISAGVATNLEPTPALAAPGLFTQDAAALELPDRSRDSAGQAGSGQQAPNPTQEVAAERPEGPALALGPARLRVGGYLGLTGVYRSTNAGGGPGTSFASIPYEDEVQGNVSEARLSAQSSRISLRIDADYPEPRPRFQRLSGYFEMDFNGATPGTVAVTSSGVGFRLRHAFTEVQYRDKFLLGAGQAFSLMTPAKDQLSIWPSDFELSQAVDTNYLAGLVWDRAPQLRLVWRPSTHFNWGVSVENPEQQLARGAVTLPGCCASDIEMQYNTGSAELEAPNLFPDIVTRIAFNPITSLHVDAGGVVRVFRHTLQPYDDDYKEVGGGASLNLRFRAASRTKLLFQGAIGSGLGRYVGGLVPDVAFRADGSISPIGTTSWVAGFEQGVSSMLSLGGYYSGVSVDEAFYLDSDGAYIGYGYPGAPNSNNRRVQQVTGTASYQIARTQDRGSAQLNLQASWLTRESWLESSGLESASTVMFFAQVRYNLP